MSRLTEGLDPLPALAREPGEAAGEAYTAAVHRWQEAIDGLEEPLRRQCAALADDAAGRAVLDRVFAFSPFLSAIATADPAFTLRIFSEGADAGVRLARDELAAAVNGGSDGGPPTTDGLMRALRQARRRTALAIALADIAGAWRLDQVTAALSDFASEALRLACRHLLGEMAASGLITPGDPAQPDAGSGLVVLGMGKLGARELNYSSDVDLIVLYDDEAIASPRPDELQAAFVRLARGLVRIMQEATRDGYVMRMDLRLRPDPAATPLAVSVHAAETYYESLGQNWERAAMIKARPVAGDIEAGERFLAHLRPFMWRRHLDFAAIQDIHSIKRQINAHRGGQTLEL
ncbi:MAG: glutamine-synthetase adenylyltransferase, partial [Alphaproteobacteria bacterium]